MRNHFFWLFFKVCFWFGLWFWGLFGCSSGCGCVFSTWLWQQNYWLWQFLMYLWKIEDLFKAEILMLGELLLERVLALVSTVEKLKIRAQIVLRFQKEIRMVRSPRFEPGSSAWQADVLDQTRLRPHIHAFFWSRYYLERLPCYFLRDPLIQLLFCLPQKTFIRT